MRATGIIRKIDDLGRIVVPKELRRVLKIREGDPVEIYTDSQGQIILKKYSPIGEMGENVTTYAALIAQMSGCRVLLTDREQVVAVEGRGKKELEGRRISKEMEHILEDRSLVNTGKTKKPVEIVEGETMADVQIICPILCESDVIGAIVLLGSDKQKELGELEGKIANMAAAFLGRLAM